MCHDMSHNQQYGDIDVGDNVGDNVGDINVGDCILNALKPFISHKSLISRCINSRPSDGENCVEIIKRIKADGPGWKQTIFGTKQTIRGEKTFQ